MCHCSIGLAENGTEPGIHLSFNIFQRFSAIPYVQDKVTKIMGICDGETSVYRRYGRRKGSPAGKEKPSFLDKYHHLQTLIQPGVEPSTDATSLPS